MVKIEQISEQQFFDLKPSWDLLLSSCQIRSIFLEWEWLYTWWECFHKNKELYVIVARSEDNDQILGIMPLCKVRFNLFGIIPIYVLQFIGRGIEGRSSIGEYSTQLDIICRNEDQNKVLPAFLEFLSNNRIGWDILLLDELEEATSRHIYLREIVRKYFFWTKLRPSLYTTYISLPKTYEEFRSRLSSKMRANVGRRTRQIERTHSVSTLTVNRKEEITPMLSIYYDFIKRRHGKELSEERKKFHHLLSERFLDKGMLRFHFFTLDKQPAVAYFGFQFANKLLYYKGAMNPDFSKFGVGSVFINRLIREAIQAGMPEFDFLIGEDEYKLNWAVSKRIWYQLVAAPFSLKGTVFIVSYQMSTFKKNLKNKIKHKIISPLSKLQLYMLKYFKSLRKNIKTIYGPR